MSDFSIIDKEDLPPLVMIFGICLVAVMLFIWVLPEAVCVLLE